MLDAFFDLVYLACENILGWADPNGEILKAAKAQRQAQADQIEETGD